MTRHLINIDYTMLDHGRGTGCVKTFAPVIGANAYIKPAKMRGALEWLKRADKRQVNVCLLTGRIWCEQQ